VALLQQNSIAVQAVFPPAPSYSTTAEPSTHSPQILLRAALEKPVFDKTIFATRRYHNFLYYPKPSRSTHPQNLSKELEREKLETRRRPEDDTEFAVDDDMPWRLQRLPWERNQTLN